GGVDPLYAEKGDARTDVSSNKDETWLKIAIADSPPINPRLSGLELEYAIVQIFSAASGNREAKIVFGIDQTTGLALQEGTLDVAFECAPAVEVALGVHDFDGKPTTASFVFQDELGRIYPYCGMRV